MESAHPVGETRHKSLPGGLGILSVREGECQEEPTAKKLAPRTPRVTVSRRFESARVH